MAKKKKNNRAVLVTSCVLAALIVAGSTFAWFTSKDEVTNRLTATSEYGVAIAESFQAPASWVPGQEINKDAAATNTGNVDAFVRMWLNGNMRLLTQKKDSANANAQWKDANSFADVVAPTNLKDVVDTNLLNASVTKLDSNGNYFKTLDKTQTTNPKTSVSTNNTGYAGNENGTNSQTGPMSEVQSMQSSILAYAPAGAKYSYVLDQETELEIYLTSIENGSSVTGYKKVQVPAGTLVIADDNDKIAATIDGTTGSLVTVSGNKVITSTSGAQHTYTSRVYIKQPTADFVPQNVEYESFTPMTDGLYLFLRDEASTNQNDPEFSGYYVSGITGQTPETGTYYALNTGIGTGTYRSDYTVKGAKAADYNHPVEVTYDANDKNIIKVVPTANLELFNAQYTNVSADQLKWYTNANKDEIYAVYDKGVSDPTEFEGDNDIAVTISLANIGTGAQNWTAIGAGTSAINNYDGSKVLNSSSIFDASNLTFYYNDDVEAGDTSAKLVDKVTLHKDVTNKAYLAFDFDLNVNLESIQVTTDENGNEQATAVSSGWAASTGNTGAKGTQEPATPSGEITKMAWGNIT